MDKVVCCMVCLIVVLVTVRSGDTRNYVSVPKLNFRSLQNLLMSSLSDDDADDNEYMDADDNYQGNSVRQTSEELYKYAKRGIGQCIFNCLKRPGQMNFIQCKSMCHKR
ncbi:uncharacterized protein LOC134719556 [Mytilus trossulus]|uniref:uncharacterized protein LOC134719556 n=1 Tax=Mytilus trossulus TaxID=6551 RepID=UPI0030068603